MESVMSLHMTAVVIIMVCWN